MVKTARWRWGVLGTALAATVAAIFFPLEEEGVAPQPPRPVATPKKAAAATVPDAQRVNAPWIAPNADPFAPRGWVAPAPMPAPVATVVATAAEVPPAPPPPPPPLPYKFVGQMRDGSETVIYLSLGDQMVVARAGETLDGGYKVAAITGNQLEFESVALGIRQTLPIPNQE